MDSPPNPSSAETQNSKNALKREAKMKQKEEEKAKKAAAVYEVASVEVRQRPQGIADDDSLDPTQYLENRLKALDCYKAAGISPYPHKFSVTMTILEFIDKISDMDATKFALFHADVKRGDIVGVIGHPDIGIPANNNGRNNIGCLYWLLARMVLKMRGTILPKQKWDVMVDLFFYREPEEPKKEEYDEVAVTTDYKSGYAPHLGGADNWNSQATDFQGVPEVNVTGPNVEGTEWDEVAAPTAATGEWV